MNDSSKRENNSYLISWISLIVAVLSALATLLNFYLDQVKKNNLIKIKIQNDLSKATDLIDDTPIDDHVEIVFKEKPNFIELEKARRLLDTQVLIKDPKNKRALELKGVYLLKIGQFNEALTVLNEAVLLYPDDFSVYNTRGTVYLAENKKDLALSDFDASIKIKPNPKAYNNRGIVFERKGELDKAIKNYTVPIKLNPDNTWVYEKRGDLWKKNKNFNNAIADYVAVLKIDQNYSEALLKIKSIVEFIISSSKSDNNRFDFDAAIEHFDILRQLYANTNKVIESAFIKNCMISLQKEKGTE